MKKPKPIKKRLTVRIEQDKTGNSVTMTMAIRDFTDIPGALYDAWVIAKQQLTPVEPPAKPKAKGR
jgi:hypothetical protein